MLTTTDGVVIQTMSRGVSHKAIALLGKHNNEQRLSSMSKSVADVITEDGVLGVMVRTNVPELKKLWSAEYHSNVSQIGGVALKMAKKIKIPVCDTNIG